MSREPTAERITPASLSKAHPPYTITAVGWGYRLDGPGVPAQNNGLTFGTLSEVSDAIKLVYSVYNAGRESK